MSKIVRHVTVSPDLRNTRINPNNTAKTPNSNRSIPQKNARVVIMPCRRETIRRLLTHQLPKVAKSIIESTKNKGSSMLQYKLPRYRINNQTLKQNMKVSPNTMFPTLATAVAVWLLWTIHADTTASKTIETSVVFSACWMVISLIAPSKHHWKRTALIITLGIINCVAGYAMGARTPISLFTVYTTTLCICWGIIYIRSLKPEQEIWIIETTDQRNYARTNEKLTSQKPTHHITEHCP